MIASLADIAVAAASPEAGAVLPPSRAGLIPPVIQVNYGVAPKDHNMLLAF